MSKEKFAAKHYLASKTIFKGDVAYIVLTKEIKKKLGLSTHEAKDFVYILDSIKGVNKYAFFFYEDDREAFSVSLRSHKASIVEIAKNSVEEGIDWLVEFLKFLINR